MATSHEVDFKYSGLYDKPTFQKAFNDTIAKSASFNAAAIPDLFALVGLIGKDKDINDVRWAAYMLATVMWETTSPTAVSQVARNKKGVPLKDKKGQLIVVVQRKWLMTMAPVEEVGHGKGRRYHEPVKVKSLADCSVQVTEQDGDQFRISAAGVVTALTKGAAMGTTDGGTLVKRYVEDDGAELAFYGRGYVQLTWWSNYASSGIVIGKGLDLLLDPDLVKQPEVAYRLMSHGMRTGKGFANGHKLSDYFDAKKTDYVSARRMVNGTDHAEDIAAIAVKFEGVLRKASKAATVPAAAAAALP